MSPEMQLPKLMWLKRHLPASWSRTAHAFDLADFLTWSRHRQPGPLAMHPRLQVEPTSPTRPRGWPHDFLAAIGLPDLLARAGLPAAATPVATDLGPLTAAGRRATSASPPRPASPPA